MVSSPTRSCITLGKSRDHRPLLLICAVRAELLGHHLELNDCAGLQAKTNILIFFNRIKMNRELISHEVKQHNKI